MTREECEKRILEKIEEAIAIADEYCNGKCEYFTVGYFNSDLHTLQFHNNNFEDKSIKPIDFHKRYDEVSE